MFGWFNAGCNNMTFSTSTPDLTTTWTSPSSSSQWLQADTPVCCSSSQRQVEVLLSSWLVTRCLDSTAPLTLGGCSWPRWLRGGGPCKPLEIKRAPDLKAPSHCGKITGDDMHGCRPGGTGCLWMGRRLSPQTCDCANAWIIQCGRVTISHRCNTGHWMWI